MDHAGHLIRLFSGIAPLILALALLSACSGEATERIDGGEAAVLEPFADVGFRKQAPMDAAGPAQPMPDMTGVPSPGSMGNGNNVAARQSQYAMSTAVGGEAYFLKSADARPDEYRGLMQLYTAANPVCWTIYAVEAFTHDEAIQSVEIAIREPWPARFFVGISDFERDTWHWIEADLIDETVALLVPTGLQAVDGSGRVLVCIAAPTKEYVEFSSIALRLDVPAPPPLGLSATQGDHKWHIELTWEDPATSYEGLEYESIWVYRRRIGDLNFSVLSELPAGTTSYTDQFNDPDNLLAAEAATFYRLRTTVAGGAGPPSEEVTGWIGPAPLNLTAQQDIVPDRLILGWEPHPYAQSAVLDYREVGAMEYAELWALEDVTNDSFEHTKTSPPGRECELGQVYDYKLRYIYSYKEEADYASASRELEQPTDVRATWGDYTDKVRLTWDSDYGDPLHDEVINFWIYRDGQEEEDIIAQVGNVREYDDTEAGDFLHKYWIRTECLGEISEFNDQPAYGGVLYEGIQSHFVYDDENSSRNSDLAVVNGKPVVACATYANYELNLVFAQALEAVPGSADDWITHEIAPCDAEQLSIVEIGGRLAIAYTYAGLKLALSSTLQPASADDWLIYEIADTYPWDFGVRMISYGDRLWIAYWADDYVRCARATTQHPISAADWETYPIIELSMSSPQNAPQLSLAIINSRLAISCKGLKYARATTDTPQNISDWFLCSLGDDSTGYYTQLLEIGGKPAIFYCDHDNHVSLAQATVAEPSSSADWQGSCVYEIGESNSCQAILVDGLPVVCFDDVGEQYNSNRGIILATALSQAPSGEDDWEVQCMLNSTQSTWTGSLLEVNGGLNLSCNIRIGNQGLVFAYLPPE